MRGWSAVILCGNPLLARAIRRKHEISHVCGTARLKRASWCTGCSAATGCACLHSVQEAPLAVGLSLQHEPVVIIDATVAFAGLALQLECAVKECIDLSLIATQRDLLVFDVIAQDCTRPRRLVRIARRPS